MSSLLYIFFSHAEKFILYARRELGQTSAVVAPATVFLTYGRKRKKLLAILHEKQPSDLVLDSNIKAEIPVDWILFVYYYKYVCSVKSLTD